MGGDLCGDRWRVKAHFDTVCSNGRKLIMRVQDIECKRRTGAGDRPA